MPRAQTRVSSLSALERSTFEGTTGPSWTLFLPNLNSKAKKKVEIETIVGATIGDSRGLRLLESVEIFSAGKLQVLIFGEESARYGIRAFMPCTGTAYASVTVSDGKDEVTHSWTITIIPVQIN